METVCTQVRRHTRAGCTRLVLKHAQEDLKDALSNILYYRNGCIRHGAHGRVIETWHDRWTSAIWHAVGTPVTGVEAAQGCKEAAVTRHGRVHDVAQAWR